MRSTRNALRRHAESVRDERSQIACRGILSALVESLRDTVSPAEGIAVIELVAHVLEGGRREDASLPVTLRAVVAFALETPRASRDAEEMLRLLLRHAYALAADHIPRQLRDDGPFRASAVRNVLEAIASEYLDDKRFNELASG